jgi:hypothetical protein
MLRSVDLKQLCKGLRDIETAAMMCLADRDRRRGVRFQKNLDKTSDKNV